MVMAPAASGGPAEWVLVRPLRPPHTGDTDRPSTNPSAKGPSSPSIIGRRSSASSSFVLAAARLRALQQDPSHTAARHGSYEDDPEEQSARAATAVTGPDHHALLTPMALMGAAMRRVLSPDCLLVSLRWVVAARGADAAALDSRRRSRSAIDAPPAICAQA